MADEKPFDVAVVGGGIAGLLVTIGLLKNKIPVTLYEAAAHFGEIGAGVSFGANATRAMALIDDKVKEGFERRATSSGDEDHKNIWFEFRYGDNKDGRAGKLITALHCPEGQASVHRAHFLDEMVKLVPDNVSRFGKRLTSLDDKGQGKGVELRFEDGTTAQHDAVIGCDGIKSRTRQILLGEDNSAAYAKFSGKYAYRGLIPMDQAVDHLGEALAKNSQMHFGPHGHVLTFPIEKGKTMNVVAFRSKDKWESEEWVVPTKKEHMVKDYEGWGKPVRGIIDLMQKPDIWALFQHDEAPFYNKGRVCLMGDAAHASTPHQGAGAGMAVEDAYVL
ncbi:hypothetical protein LTS18_000821, partial [Coniosporium uncinatum]